MTSAFHTLNAVPPCSHPVPLFLSCTFEYFPATFDEVGQNTFWEAHNYDQSKRNWRVHIANWLVEYKSCPVATIANFRDRSDGVRIGHFTQVI